MMLNTIDTAAAALADLYGASFGGKVSGRYRMSRKLAADLLGRRRLYAEDVQALSRALLEKGYVLVDMDTFFVILSANAFVNYRRANAECLPVPPNQA